LPWGGGLDLGNFVTGLLFVLDLGNFVTRLWDWGSRFGEFCHEMFDVGGLFGDCVAGRSGFVHSMIAAGPSQLAVGGVLDLGNFVTRLLLGCLSCLSRLSCLGCLGCLSCLSCWVLFVSFVFV